MNDRRERAVRLLHASDLHAGESTDRDSGIAQVVDAALAHDVDVLLLVGDIFDHSLDGGKLVHGAIQFDRGDRSAFERREQHAADRVSNGVAVAGFKRLSDEFCVCFRCAGFFFDQALRHFETT